MSGHWAYVWSAYGVAAVVLAGLLLASLRGLRARQAEVELLDAARGRGRSGP